MKIGSLFSGYAGLDQAVEAVTGADTVWLSDIDPGASKILAHRFPDIPNHGDLTKIDWSQVEPVDILTGGFPCQDLSHAGKRAGLRPDTRSGLWTHMAYAIDQLRPSLVVAENVRGLLSAEASGDVEPCPWCMGDDEGSPLRALGAVLADLAELGYDAAWCGLRAADVGAPHGRFRVFVVAWPSADADRAGSQGAQPASRRDLPAWGAAADPGRLRRIEGRPAGRGEATGGWALGDAAGRGLLPTPRATDGTKGGPNQRGSSGDLMLPSAVALLPTPAVNDMGEGKTPQAWDEWTAKMKAAHKNGNGHGPSLAIEAQRMFPTPKASDGDWGTPRTSRRPAAMSTHLATSIAHNPWGSYATAIARWESLTRPAPAPTMTSTKGTPQLSPAFSEWLMGLPAGWVTDVPGLTRAQQLKALGNGVVPQQATAALEHLLALAPSERAA